jgi:RNA polymerase sigma factor for flagellar operon FliA
MSDLRQKHRDMDSLVELSEIALWQACRSGSAEARQSLFELHLPFARRIASRRFHQQSGTGVEFADLFQLACAGLLEAIDGYDPERGVPFRGYAARRVGGSILDGIARMTEVREQLSFRRRAERERMASLASDASGSSAADAMAALADLALGVAVGFMLEGTGLLAGAEAADPAPGPYDGLAFRRMVAHMHEAIAALPARERAILRYHYEEGMVFDQIGDLLGITKGRVSQLHRAALALLRKRLRQTGHFRFEG